MGDPVAMVHCNNGCGELDKWVELFGGDYAARLTRANVIRAELKAVFATLAKGMEILRAEGVYPASLVGHGGLFKTRGVAERVLSDMLGIPVSARATAGEGGAWGIARLAMKTLSVRP